MKKKRDVLVLFWSLLVVIVLAVLGFYLLAEIVREPKTEPQKENISSVQETDLFEERQAFDDIKDVPRDSPSETVTVLSGPDEKIDISKLLPEEDPCIQAEKDLADFFSCLDGAQYIHDLNLKTDTYSRIKGIVKRLSASPPVHVGVENDPIIITRNITHFIRVLGPKDLHLISEILIRELDSDTMEIDLKMFYYWFMFCDRNFDPENFKPPMDVIYSYSGFFLNTIGGRAYLYRRALALRLLVGYYCLLIVHEADKTGGNIYGLDIFPHISTIKQEISYFPDFQYKQEYLTKLTQIHNYYMQKRHLNENGENSEP